MECKSKAISFQMYINKDDKFIKVETICDKLTQYKIRLSGKMITYYSSSNGTYLYLGIYNESNKNIKIPVIDNIIKIRYKKSKFKYYVDNIKKYGRGNERTISEAVILVGKWQKQQRTSDGRKAFSLTISANYMDISKKTLDEYYRQIKMGLKNNFNFIYYKNSPIGVLRQFNSKIAKFDSQ